MSPSRHRRIAPAIALLFASPALQGGVGARQNFEERLLAAHNRERDSARRPSAQVGPRLARSARDWARHLARTGRFEHSPDNPWWSEPEGENLWAGTVGYYQPKSMVGLWAVEKRDYKPGVFPNNSRSGQVENVSHYTQLVWASTGTVGCALEPGPRRTCWSAATPRPATCSANGRSNRCSSGRSLSSRSWAERRSASSGRSARATRLRPLRRWRSRSTEAPTGISTRTRNVNGHDIRFLVDTGASEMALTEEDARKAGIAIDPQQYELLGQGASGIVRGQYVELKTIDLGGIHEKNAKAVVVQGATVSLLGNPSSRASTRSSFERARWSCGTRGTRNARRLALPSRAGRRNRSRQSGASARTAIQISD